MKHKSWRDIGKSPARHSPKTPSPLPPADLEEIARQNPSIQSLMAERAVLEEKMQSLTSGLGNFEPSHDQNRFPVTPLAERNAEIGEWASKREALLSARAKLKKQEAPRKVREDSLLKQRTGLRDSLRSLDERPANKPRDDWSDGRDADLARQRARLTERKTEISKLSRLSRAALKEREDRSARVDVESLKKLGDKPKIAREMAKPLAGLDRTSNGLDLRSLDERLNFARRRAEETVPRLRQRKPKSENEVWNLRREKIRERTAKRLAEVKKTTLGVEVGDVNDLREKLTVESSKGRRKVAEKRTRAKSDSPVPYSSRTTKPAELDITELLDARRTAASARFAEKRKVEERDDSRRSRALERRRTRKKELSIRGRST